MADPTPAEGRAATFPPHPKVGELPTMTNPCNGVGCGCGRHPQTEADRRDR